VALQRIKSGTKFKPSAKAWNAMAASAERSEESLRGFGSESLPITRLGERVTIKNVSGGDLGVGRVVQLGLYLPGSPTNEHLWFEASTPASAAAVHAVLREPVADTQFGEAQLLGACVARVNVGDVDHTCCLVTAATELTSSPIGPHRLIHAPGTSSQLCVVILGGGIMVAHGVCAEAAGIDQDATGTITIGGKSVEAENHTGLTIADTVRVRAYIESGEVFAEALECSGS
jgi:hypothetical protein